MKCFACEDDARAVCQFCGRAVCTSHRKSHVLYLGFGTKTRNAIFDSGSETGYRIRDASWCGECRPEPQKTF